MPDDSLLPERTEMPPFIKPYLQKIDRMQQRQTLRPEQHTERARHLLDEHYGRAEGPVEAAFTHGAIGLLAGHTHYADGYAVLMPLQQGTAVAVRVSEAKHSQISFEGDDTRWTYRSDEAEGAGEQPAWIRIVTYLIQKIAGARQLDVGVVSTVPPGCMDAYLAALAVAAARAMQALLALPERTRDILPTLCDAVATSTGLPFSTAYLIAADAGMPEQFILTDTATGEHLALDAPPHDRLGWGLVDVGTGQRYDAGLHQERKERASNVLASLQENGFPQLASIQQLEHRDLERALQVIPRRLRAVLRHLVSENRRVQKLVVAARRRDWQLFGAMLLMSHASLRDDWSQTNEEVDLVVEQVEVMSLDGMDGACVTGRSGCVLVLGKPFVVPACLDRIEMVFEERFGSRPEVMVL